MKNFFLLASTIIVVFAFFIYPARAEMGKFQVGNMTVLPSLGVEHVTDDNIYLGNGTNAIDEEEVGDHLARCGRSVHQSKAPSVARVIRLVIKV